MSETCKEYPGVEELASEIEAINLFPGLANNFPGFLPYGYGRAAFLWNYEHDGTAWRKAFTPSNQYGGKSFMEFMNDINIAIDQNGIPLTEIERLQAYKSAGDPVYCELVRLTLPAYRSLRAQGYTSLMLQR